MVARYDTDAQRKNLAWVLPRPKPDHYKGGMPLYAEEWLVALARDILNNPAATVLNIFCGMNTIGLRVDIKEEVHPDICCDVHDLSRHLNGDKYDIVLADPPYSNEEAANLYQTPKLKYKQWAAEAGKALREGGLLIVYHKLMMPNPNPEIFTVEKRVFIGNRTGHLPRVAIYFKKKPNEVHQSH